MFQHRSSSPFLSIALAALLAVGSVNTFAAAQSPPAPAPRPPQLVREVIGRVSQGKLEIALGHQHANGVEVHYRERHYADGRIEVLLFRDAALSEPLRAKVTIKKRISNAAIVAAVETTLNERPASFEIRMAKKEGFNIANLGPAQLPTDPQWVNPRNEGPTELDRTNYPWGWPSYYDQEEFTFWVFGYSVFFSDPGDP